TAALGRRIGQRRLFAEKVPLRAGELLFILVVVPPAAGQAVRGALGRGPQDARAGIAPGIGRGDVVAIVVRIRVVGVVGLDGKVPVVDRHADADTVAIGGSGQLRAGRRAAASAEHVRHV